MIVLDVPAAAITRGVNGVLFANGGGGGEGGDPSSPGMPGSSPGAPTPAAFGGGTVVQGNMDGGNGGDGSAGAETNGRDAFGGARSGGGGGGGGGGAGFIHAPGIMGDAVISPVSLDLPPPSA